MRIFCVQIINSFVRMGHVPICLIVVMAGRRGWQQNDNGKEIVVSGRMLNPDGSLGCNGKVYLVRADGTLRWEATVRADANSSAALGDSNGDDYADVVVGMGAWNADGENAGNECAKPMSFAIAGGGQAWFSSSD